MNLERFWFRGKSLPPSVDMPSETEWVFGQLYHDTNVDKYYLKDEDGMSWEVDPLTVGQRIIVNISGDAVWEMDITLIQGKRYVILWDKQTAGFYLDDLRGDTIYRPLHINSATIIGNLIDNPTLIPEPKLCPNHPYWPVIKSVRLHWGYVDYGRAYPHF